jgi:dipeptidyl-peptidase 4
LKKAALRRQIEVGWKAPEGFAAPGRDGKTMIYGIIIYPSAFDVSKTYPVLEQISAGPQDYSAPKAFSTLIEQHELAELGFIIM